MVRTLIIDEETPVRARLTELLRLNCPDLEVVGEAPDVKDGVRAILELRPDLVIMGIYLENGTCFDVLRHLHPVNFRIIFLTPCEKNLMNALEFTGLDYLLKPIDPEVFIRVMNESCCPVPESAVSWMLDDS